MRTMWGNIEGAGAVKYAWRMRTMWGNIEEARVGKYAWRKKAMRGKILAASFPDETFSDGLLTLMICEHIRICC